MDIESWEKLLDSKPNDFTTRLVYADWLEEQGLVNEAQAQRWMGTHHKFPKRTRRQRVWDAVGLGSAYIIPWRWFREGQGRYLTAMLPQEVWVCFTDLKYYLPHPRYDHGHSMYFSTRQEAELALSQALERLPHAL